MEHISQFVTCSDSALSIEENLFDIKPFQMPVLEMLELHFKFHGWLKVKLTQH